MANTVTIGCRLPSGLVLQVGNKTVELAGQRQTQERSPIILLSEDDYGTTEVDEAFWLEFKKLHPATGDNAFAPLASGAIFEAKNAGEAKAKARDLKGEKTGHEAMSQDAKGIESADKAE